jgi:hypothetical protein
VRRRRPSHPLLFPLLLLVVAWPLGCAPAVDAPRVDPTDAATDAAHEAAPAGTVRYATSVVSFTPGDGAGYGKDKLPGVVLGPPNGSGCCAGSTDVVSLGNGGEIVLAFDSDIVDGPGVDLLVFENAFMVGGDPTVVLAEPGEVAVSEDGKNWTAWPCTAKELPYGSCAGWHAVYATPETGVVSAGQAGGDPFDLADIGVTRARYVRIRDMNKHIAAKDGMAGFDLDAIAALHTAP